MDDAQLIEKPAAEVIPPPAAPPARKAQLNAGSDVAAIIPTNVDEVARYADAVIAAGMVPDSYSAHKELPPQGHPADANSIAEWRAGRTKARVMLGVMKGLEVGMGPLTALSTIAIINNRPCVWGDGAVALAQRDGRLEWFRHSYTGTAYNDDYTCVVEIKRRGQAQPYRSEFSVAKAKRARLWGNTSKAPWIDQPDRMLFNRARAFALRDGFADCLMGLAIAEEVLDIDAPKPEAKPDPSFLDDAPAPAAQPAALEHKPEIPVEPVTQPEPEPAAVVAQEAAPAATEQPAPAAPTDWAELERSIMSEINDAAPRGAQAVGDVMRARVAEYTNAPIAVRKRIMAHAERAKAPKGKR